MITLEDFYSYEEEFSKYTEDGMSRSDIADFFGLDREEFHTFIENEPYAKKVELKAKFVEKSSRISALKTAAAKGNMTAINALDANDGTPPLKVEFVRGDMRTPDEIIITNTETHEKKSLESLLYSEACLKS